jgi:hypothetical protein
MLTRLFIAGLLTVAHAANAQDADLTIWVAGSLFEHGGVVEVTALPSEDGSSAPQTITVSDRYARVQFRHPVGESYNYRFEPSSELPAQAGIELFKTEALSVGGRTVETANGPVEGDWRSIRILPFEEYGGEDDATRTAAAWGETVTFAAQPPANHWGARALPWAFDTFGNRRTVRLICNDQNAVTVCTPDPDDALLLEALWWRQIAEGRLGRLRHDALRDCYDSGWFFARPDRCEGEAGRGWPSYRPD